MVDADQVAVLCTKYVHMNTIMDDADGLMVVRQDQDGIPKWKQKQIFWQNFEPRGMSTVLSDTREKSFTTHILLTIKLEDRPLILNWEKNPGRTPY